MIPKIIHYCWISDESNMPADIKACIESWHKHLPDYQFINWNDSNFDWNICEFTKHCRENNLYAFCSDYIRFWALYNYGGIYLDSDVMVYKSFDQLLKLKRIITKENSFSNNDFYEAAIMGCVKGDEAFGKIVEWYNKTEEVFSKEHYIVAPHVMNMIWNSNYKHHLMVNLNDELNEDNIINVLSVEKYFDYDSPDAFAQHQFKTSWLNNGSKNCLANDNIKIFLCAHKPINNYIPKNKKYIILDTTGNVINEYNNDFHEIIDISKDEFTKEHNVAYSEGCAIRYLYNHPDIIPDYICFGHYRRMFLDFVGSEKLIARVIDNYGSIVKTPFDHSVTDRKTNKEGMYKDHPKDDVDVFITCVKEAAPEYWNSFQELLDDHYQYACNCFAMRKEHFMEMCEMCFKVLDLFDQKQGYKNNDDVFRKMIKESHRKHLRYGINWQCRLQGFFLEWLTELYYRKKFGVNNCYKSEAAIPVKKKGLYK